MLYFPVFLGPITVSYNLSGVSNLKLDPTTLADIFGGKITSWNDPAIAALNPGVSLPSTPITTAVRSDSSGTTQNFSLYLEKAAEQRVDARQQLDHQVALQRPGRQRQPRGGADHQVHPRGHRLRGLCRRQGLRAELRLDQELLRRLRRALSVVGVGGRERDHRRVEPHLRRGRLPGAAAYPITYQSWVLVYETQPNANDAAMLKAYIGYLLGPASSCCPAWATPRCRLACSRRPKHS